jgi:hypothetical protein
MQEDADGEEQSTRTMEEGEREFIREALWECLATDATTRRGFVDRKLYFVVVPRDTSTSKVIKRPRL